MSLCWIVWDIAICFVEAALIIYLYSSQLRIRKNSYIYIGFLSLFVAINLTTFFAPNFYSRIALNYLACLIVAIITCENSIQVKLIFSVLPLLFSNIAEGMVLNFLAYFNDEMNAVNMPSFIRFQFGVYTLLISMVIYFIAANIRTNFFQKDNLFFPNIVKAYVVMLLLVSCYTIQISSDIAIWLSENSDMVELQTKITIISLALMIFSIGLIVLVVWNGYLNKKHIEKAMESDRIKNQYERLKDAEAISEELSIQKHDMHGHLEVMATLINDGKTDELLTYFTNYSERLYETTQHTWMQNPSINACLTVKRSRSATYGIRFNVISKLQRELPLEPIDACSLIGNMLDNAIEACTKIEDSEKRYIDLRIIEHRENIIISVENSANNVTSITEGQSDKGESGGLGLKQMNSLVKKAGGFLCIEPECEKVIISAVFPID